MSSPVANMSRLKPGMCPHGMPAGSCPICNGMGGGASSNKRPDVRKAGEMSWSECFAMGQRMKADKAHQQQIIQDRRDAQIAQLQLQTKLSNAAQRLERIADMVVKNLPMPVNKIANFAIKNIALPIIKIAQTATNFIQNITANLTTLTTNLKENLQGLQEKFAAIFGEIFNAKEKSLSERFKLARKKVFGFLFNGEEEKLELKEVEEKDREMDLKQVKDSLLNLTKYEKEVTDELDSTV